ncbi:histamine H2 receptor isoform X1 [Hydra vulgaris]|uniref:histamine H2 receptor isoform X1 n=1 Tax=Hydra vulgaris TaxID=6087 RepID=UPI001F5ED3C0|nr:histamine H2 receptor [Hydra vulgaris]
MNLTMREIKFQCCFERALNVQQDQIHKAANDCAVYMNKTGKDFWIFFTNFISSYLQELENATSKCDEPNWPDECMKPTKNRFLAYFVFWIVALLVGFVANILVIFVFYQSKTLRKNVTNYFIVSLACSDLLVIVFIIPYKAYQTLHNHNFCGSISICKLYFTTDVTFFAASITNLFAIAVDRYLAVTMPYRYKKILSKRCARIAIASIWIYSCLWGVFANFNFKTLQFDAAHIKDNQCTISNGIETVIQYFMIFYIPSIAMLLLYAKILRVTFSHANHIEAINRSVQGKARRKSSGLLQLISDSKFFVNRRIEFRATKVVVVVYGTFMICWFPLITIVVTEVLTGKSITSNLIYVLFGEILPLLNSILNAFIYGIMHRDYKNGLKQVFRKFVSETIYVKTTDFFGKKNSRASLTLKSPESDGCPNNEILNVAIKKDDEDDAYESAQVNNQTNSL